MRFCSRSSAAASGYLLMSSVAMAIGPGFNGEVSYEHLNLPKTEFTYYFDFGAQAPTSVKDENHDGGLDGARLDLSLGGRGALEGIPIIAGVKGYYAEHESVRTSRARR